MPSSCPKFFELMTERTIFSPSDFRSSHSPAAEGTQLNFAPRRLCNGSTAPFSIQTHKGRGGVRGGEGSGPDREI